MTTIGTKLLSIVVVILIALGILGYVHHTGVQAERDRAAKAAAEKYEALSEQYDKINSKYVALRMQKSAKRQEAVAREDKIINENRDYYAGDCFDAVGLQHIQDSQSANSK